MKDRPALASLKLLVAALWRLDLALRRAWTRLRDKRRWKLVGACRACGRCCVEPTIAAGSLLWYLPLTRRLFLAWQKRVNGLELCACDRESRAFVFRCTHYDPASKRCDSYVTRPGMCRDYPRLLLGQPWPELFEECGFRVQARNAERLRAQIDATNLPEPARAALRRKLRLD